MNLAPTIIRGWGEDVHYDGSINPWTYIALDNTLGANPPPTPRVEFPNIVSQANAYNFYPSDGTPCDQRPLNTYGAGQYGLFRSTSGATPPWQTWEEKILQNQDTPGSLHELTLKLIRYCESTNQLTQLETFNNGLSLLNAAAFERISFVLDGSITGSRNKKRMLNGYGLICSPTVAKATRYSSEWRTLTW